MKIQSQPYHLLVPIIILILVLSLFVGWSLTTDIHTHDTYYIIPTRYFIQAYAVFLILLWCIYRFTNKLLLSSIVTWVHLGITIILVITLVGFTFWPGIVSGAGMPRRYIDYSDFDAFKRLNNFLTAMTLALLFSQALYIINLAGGLLFKKKSRNHP